MRDYTEKLINFKVQSILLRDSSHFTFKKLLISNSERVTILSYMRKNLKGNVSYNGKNE